MEENGSNRNPVAEGYLQQLAKDYDLVDTDFWYHQQSNCWILYHDACMRIAYLSGVEFDTPVWLSTGENGYWAVQVSGRLNEQRCWTTGEAGKDNTWHPYLVAMAEKRAKDRLVLSLLGASQLGIKADVEAESFSRAEVSKHQRAVTELRKLGATDEKIARRAESMFSRRGRDWQRLTVDQLRDLYRSLRNQPKDESEPETKLREEQ